MPILALAAASSAWAQNVCEGTPAYTPCDLVFELSPSQMQDPYASVQLDAEFRSPRFKTYLIPAFWAGANRVIIRFTPTEAGQWTYKLAGNVTGLSGKEGSFTANASSSPGFVNVANVHHWATDNKQPHLWMAYIFDQLAFAPEADFTRALDTAVANKFTHIRGSILGGPEDSAKVVSNQRPNPAFFENLDARLLAIHKRGLTIDLVLASDPAYFVSLFPDWQARQRFVRYVVARYSGLNITWMGFKQFEDAPNGRALLKEVGLALKQLDPYRHPRSTNAKITSSPLLADGWMDFIIEGSMDDQVGSVEHQFYQVPFVGTTDAQHLWNATMDGEYPEFEGAQENVAKSWFEFVSDTRYWELEPYFDLDQGRAVALEDVEYLIYIEKPAAPVEVTVEKHGYDIVWLNPLTGSTTPGKGYKGEHFTGETPDRSHPWVLLIAREGRKESMLKSYKFESRPVPVQEVESNTSKVPYEIAQPSSDHLVAGRPVEYAAKIKRETRATRSMMYLWTGEVPADGQSFRVLGTGAQGTFQVPPVLLQNREGVLSLRVMALNANGKAYSLDKIYQLSK